MVEVRRPNRIVVRASGDLVGQGEWELRKDDAFIEMTYTWRVAATKPWMRWFAPALRPLFAANHHWVMRRSEIGLARELERRHATAR